MPLIERFFPISRPSDFYFFDSLRNSFEADFLRMKSEMMNRKFDTDFHLTPLRRRLFELTPYESILPTGSAIDIKPEHPFIVEEKGETKLKLDFNVHGFKAEEIQVKIVGNNVLQVLANSIEKTEHGESKRHHMSQYTLPKGILCDSIKPTLSKDGVLTIEAQAPEHKSVEKVIAIENKV